MLLFWPVTIPFLTAALCLLCPRSGAAQRGLSLAGALALLGVAVLILARVIGTGPFAEQAGGWAAPFGITMVADGLSATMVLLVGLVAVATTVFGLGDVTAGETRAGHHPLTNALLAGLCGAFLTGDIFNLYVWFEVMLIATFGLLVVRGGAAAISGAMIYVGLNLIATVAFISGVGLLYGATGALNMADLHQRLAGRGDETAILVAAAFLIFAFGSKAALFPALFWLPASYHTPSFTTSALFAALLTKVGVYALIRVFTLVFPTEGTAIQATLLWGAGLTMVAGACGALVETSTRRVLNHTIISSIGFMILGLALRTPLAMLGAVYSLFQDVIVKASLYLAAGAAARMTGAESFARSGGLWRAHPWLAVLFLVPALSLAGVPPFPGFWGKLVLLRATLEVGDGALAALILGVSLLTLFAVARIWSEIFWKPAREAPSTAALPAASWVTLALLATLIAAAGIWAGPLVAASTSVANGLLDPAAYVAAVLGDIR